MVQVSPKWSNIWTWNLLKVFFWPREKKLIFGTPYIYSNYTISKTENMFAISPSQGSMSGSGSYQRSRSQVTNLLNLRHYHPHPYHHHRDPQWHHGCQHPWPTSRCPTRGRSTPTPAPQARRWLTIQTQGLRANLWTARTQGLRANLWTTPSQGKRWTAPTLGLPAGLNVT